MAECKPLLTSDILLNCDTPTVAGIENTVVLINRDDIDRTATTFSTTNPNLMTNLALKTGKKGFKVEGIKQILSAGFELVVGDYVNRFTHRFSGSILNLDSETLNTLNELGGGANLIAVIETRYKGSDSKEPYKVLGYSQGLELSTATWSSNENEGTIQIELTSVEGREEPVVPFTLLETDYDTTKTAFDNSFASA